MLRTLWVDKGNVLRILKWTLYIAALMALAALAFPISVAKAEPKLVFIVDLELEERQPKPLPVYGPFVSEIKKESPPKKTVIPKQEKKSFNPCNCWSYVKSKKPGMKTGYGKARNYPVNSQVPQIGAIIITYESSSGHMGIVARVDENNVIIDDYNYKRCSHTIRSLPLNSKLIKGYII